MNAKNLYFMTGNYAQRCKEFISENHLLLSCLVFGVKTFFQPLSGGGSLGGGGWCKRIVRQKISLNKNLCIG